MPDKKDDEKKEKEQTEQLVNLVDSRGIAVGSVPKSKADWFIKNRGYSIETPEQAEARRHYQDLGAAEAFARNFANEALLGVPGEIVENTQSEAMNRALEQRMDEHGLASALGSIAGFGASLAVGGPVFKGAAKAGSLAEKGALNFLSRGARAADAITDIGRVGKAADAGVDTLAVARALQPPGALSRAVGTGVGLGVESAAIALPAAITEAALGDPSEAAEDLFVAGGFGSLLGVGGSLMKPIAKTALNAAGKPIGLNLTKDSPLDEMVKDQTIRSLMYGTDKKARDLIRAKGDDLVVKYLHEKKLIKNVGEDFEQYATRIRAEKDNVGREIGDLYKALDDVGAVGPSMEDFANRVQLEVVNPLKKIATKKREAHAIESYLKSLDDSTKLINAERGLPEDAPLKLTDLWEQRKALDAKIYAEQKAALGNPSPLNQEYMSVRKIVDEEIKKHGDDALKGVGKSFTDPLAKLNKEYTVLSVVDDVLERSITSEQSRRNFSLSDYLTGGFGGLTIGSAFANPLAAFSGLATSLGNKFLRENGNALIAQYGNQLSLYLADMAKKEAANQLGRIPKLLKNFASNTKYAPAVGASKSSRIFDEEEDDDKAFEKYQRALANYQTGGAEKDIIEVARALQNGAPNIANQYAAQQKRAMDYLYSALPKNPMEQKPFANPWKPTKEQMREFKNKLDIVKNPWVVMSKLEDGTLNTNHLDALKNVYPSTYGRIVDEIKAYGYENPKMPYSKKLRLGLLINEPLDPRLDNLTSYQEVYAQEQKQAKPSSSKLDKLPGAEYTRLQKIMG